MPDDEEWEEVEAEEEEDPDDDSWEDDEDWDEESFDSDMDDGGFCPECDAHIEGGDEHEEDCPYYDEDD